MEENVQVQSTTLFQDAMKKGLILGAIHIIVFLILYAAAPGKLTGLSTLIFTIALNIGYIIYNGLQWRKEIGGIMNYGTAFKHAFFTFLFNGILGFIFMIIFILVDPTLPELMAQSQIDTSVYWAGKMGAPGEALDKMRDEMDMDKLRKQFGLLGQLKGFGFLLLFYALGASIIALITRKKEPEVL
jgi:hypothetical protein